MNSKHFRAFSLTCLFAISISARSDPRLATALYSPSSKGVTWSWEAWRSQQGIVNWAGVETDARMMREAGITWARIGVSERVDPKYIEMLLSITRRYGISIVCCVSPDIKYPAQYPLSAGEQRAMSLWLARSVDRFKPDIHVWEIHNEENLDESWYRKPGDDPSDLHDSVARYVRYLSTCYATIKVHDPSALVIMGGLSEWKAEPWLREFISLGGGDFTDALTIHPYAKDPDTVIARLRSITAAAQSNPSLSAKPVWITEVGFHCQKTWRTPGCVATEELKAADLNDTMRHLRDEGITTPICWYDLHELGANVNGYGLVVITSREQGSVFPLPAYTAYKNLWAQAPAPPAQPAQPIRPLRPRVLQR